MDLPKDDTEREFEREKENKPKKVKRRLWADKLKELPKRKKNPPPPSNHLQNSPPRDNTKTHHQHHNNNSNNHSNKPPTSSRQQHKENIGSMERTLLKLKERLRLSSWIVKFSIGLIVFLASFTLAWYINYSPDLGLKLEVCGQNFLFTDLL